MNMHRPDPAARRIAEMAEEIEILREEVTQLRALLVPEVRMPAHWRLSRLEDRLARAFLGVGLNSLTNDRAMAALYGDADDAPEPKIVACLVCKLRKKLKAAHLPVVILCTPLEGYRLTPEGLGALRAAVAAETDLTRNFVPTEANPRPRRLLAEGRAASSEVR